jgi:DNA mismatch repair protein MutL
MAQEVHSTHIRRLPEHLANQIAAGEVVQRPESVVKELVENAIDAGAEHVTIIIANAGKTLIQVIDDGAGMSEEDARLAFERHATSKIASYEDLERIVTFGFRGEALPSIASVSQVEMRTRMKEEDTATLLRIQSGTFEEISRTEGPTGTSITVRNLFYNTPARRQFLKTNTTEYRHIVDSVQRFILSYPNVRITFISDGSTIHDVMPGALRDRAEAVFGQRAAESLIEVGEQTDLITISGFVGRPNFARKTRGEQYLFVNGRYVINRLLNHAIVSCYENMIAAGEYPLYVLFLNIDPAQVDVNVHPAKLEVKFSNERNIYTILNAVIRQSMYQHDLSPSIEFRESRGDGATGDSSTGFSSVRLTSPQREGSAGARYDSYASVQRDSGAGAQWPGPRETPSQGSRMDAAQIDDLFRSLNLGAAGDASAGTDAVILPSERPVSDTQFLWQLHNKYIFAPIKSGLMIIDQHVAHERILYEKALTALEHAAPFSQQLLFEHAVHVSPADFALAQSINPELARLGFILRLSSPDMLTVEAVPQDVRPGMEESILEEILEQYKEYQGSGITDRRHNVAASYGCRAAIKAGDKLSAPEMQMLIDQLFAASNPYVCPHGRPVIIKLSLDELDRRFGRSG